MSASFQGKGIVTTYWLLGEKNVEDPLLYYESLRAKQLQQMNNNETDQNMVDPSTSIHPATDTNPQTESFVKNETEVLISDRDEIVFSDSHGNHVNNAPNQALLGNADQESIL